MESQKTTRIIQYINIFIENKDIMENEEDLDLSWLEEHKRILSISENYQREPLEYITFHFCYINDNLIHKILTEKYIFSDENNTENQQQQIKYEEFQKIIEAKTQLDKYTYKFTDYATFIVDLEPEHIQLYSKTDSSLNFFKQYSSLELEQNILCPQSIFIFHSINAIFVILKKQDTTLSTTHRSILKKHAHITKKRVKFHNKTKRNRDSLILTHSNDNNQ